MVNSSASQHYHIAPYSSQYEKIRVTKSPIEVVSGHKSQNLFENISSRPMNLTLSMDGSLNSTEMGNSGALGTDGTSQFPEAHLDYWRESKVLLDFKESNKPSPNSRA